MCDFNYYITNFKDELNKLHLKKITSTSIESSFYDPRNMGFLDKYEGVFNESTGEFIIRFDVRGTRYDGRTELIELMNSGERLHVLRDECNKYNPNNFVIYNEKKWDVGNMPAELCYVIAPLYDQGLIKFESAEASYIEPITKRSIHAKQAVLFVELKGILHEKL